MGRADDVLRGPTALSHPELAKAVVLIGTYISPSSPLGKPGTKERSALGQLIDGLASDSGAAAFEAMYRSFFSAHAGAIAA
ncbi:MAG: hypothetical protein ABI658_27440 [Acidimicrobiales bacterium]